MDAIQLSIFANRVDAICSEMGVALQHSAFSPNIRDRLDYSCAIFDDEGRLCAQAAHIPVHLGSMAYAMADLVGRFDWQPGDMVVLNDPYKGGTHLPDVTLLAPVFINNDDNDCVVGFVANRAHHADIGSETPGSMPLSSKLEEEGLVIEPCLLVRYEQIIDDVFDSLMSSMRNPQESRGDFIAQVAANRRGVQRLVALVAAMGLDGYRHSLDALNDYGHKLAMRSLADIPDGRYCFEDVMDGDGIDEVSIDGIADKHGIPVRVAIEVSTDRIHVDFTGTADQVKGNINCPVSVTAAAVYYVFRCLMPSQTPACAGSFSAISISAPEASLVNACYPAAVAAGNVETSTRIVDVVLGALAQVIPERIPAASHGSMNNLALGSSGGASGGLSGSSAADKTWDYYETSGGGMGASHHGGGLDGVQTHMTNTLNTPIESLEMMYPLRVLRYALRQGSGGRGRHTGGEGLCREYQFLQDAQFTLLTERRDHAPWGIAGGADGAVGENRLNGELLPGKVTGYVKRGDVLTILTPGGGGYGAAARIAADKDAAAGVEE